MPEKWWQTFGPLPCRSVTGLQPITLPPGTTRYTEAVYCALLTSCWRFSDRCRLDLTRSRPSGPRSVHARRTGLAIRVNALSAAPLAFLSLISTGSETVGHQQRLQTR